MWESVEVQPCWGAASSVWRALRVSPTLLELGSLLEMAEGGVQEHRV